MHGQYPNEVKKEHIDEELTWNWLKNGELKGETEALITSCQDQALATNYYKAKILKTGQDPKCRLCKTEDETIHHIISGCSILAPKEYLTRHNAVAAHLHWNICKAYGIEVCDKWYEHKPKPVTDSPNVTVIWDLQLQTDRHIPSNKPDITIKDKSEKRCYLIDVAIPSDYNVTKKEAKKRTKYKDMEIEAQRLWDIKTVVIYL